MPHILCAKLARPPQPSTLQFLRLRYSLTPLLRKQKLYLLFQELFHLKMFNEDVKNNQLPELTEAVFELLGPPEEQLFQGGLLQGQRCPPRMASEQVLGHQVSPLKVEAPLSAQSQPSRLAEHSDLEIKEEGSPQDVLGPTKTAIQEGEEKVQSDQIQRRIEQSFREFVQEETECIELDFGEVVQVARKNTIQQTGEIKQQALSQSVLETKQEHSLPTSLELPLEAPQPSTLTTQAQEISVIAQPPILNPADKKVEDLLVCSSEADINSNEYQKLQTSSNVIEPECSEVVENAPEEKTTPVKRETPAKTDKKKEVSDELLKIIGQVPSSVKERKDYKGASKFMLVVLSLWILWVLL